MNVPNGLNRPNKTEWTKLNQNRPKTEWTELTEKNQMALIGPNRLKWTEIDRIGLSLTELD